MSVNAPIVGTDGDVQAFCRNLIEQAAAKRASDLLLQSQQSGLLKIRIRVDGSLTTIAFVRKEEADRVTSRFKVMADLKMDEHRRPLDGKAVVNLSGNMYDLRINSLPTCNGKEDIAIRLLDRNNVPRNFDQLGFTPEMIKTLEFMYRQPYGMVISTGPTGSGKSTTMNAILSACNNDEVNILTVEDPVEYATDGITQVQVNDQAGLDFPSALRAFLRHDPDIIMVGEIRDSATAKIAVSAALTGHLVLSTLHTNDAPAAITRLVEMGVEPYTIPDAVMGVIGQRLVGRICPKCKEAYEIDSDQLRKLGFTGDTNKVTVYRGKGCDHCIKGRHGRIGIYEIMRMSEEIAALVTGTSCDQPEGRRIASVNMIRAQAIKEGMIPMRYDALQKLLEGYISLDQAQRFIHE